MEQVRCAVCGGARHARAWARIAADDYAPRVPGAPARSRWVVCRDCGLVFQNPRPDAAEVADLYSGSGYRDWGEVPEHFLEYSRRRARPALEWLEGLPEYRAVAGRGAALDVGCGVGGSVKELAERGWQAYGVEPDPMLGRAGSERFGVPIATDFVNDALFPGVDFDLVFSIHTFEHLLDPLDVVRCARALLTRSGSGGGLIFVSVPTYAHATHGAWAWMNTSHTYLFTARSLGNLLARGGFRVLHAFYPGPTYHACSEPSEVWVLATPTSDPSPALDRESLAAVQLTLASVPLRWRAAGALRRLRRLVASSPAAPAAAGGSR